jgi:TonB family protein
VQTVSARKVLPPENFAGGGRWIGSFFLAAGLTLVFMLAAIRPDKGKYDFSSPFIELGFIELPAAPKTSAPARVITPKQKPAEALPPAEEISVPVETSPVMQGEADFSAKPAEKSPTSPAPVSAPSEIRLEPGVSLDNVTFFPVFNPGPVYPAVAIAARISGYVDADLFINEQGRVERFSIVSVDGHPAFGNETAKVLSKWRFPPPRRDGKAIRVKYLYRINFKLD